jgi:5-methyltetrahydropteroyltriglutamate--homocysteine methyltransferase
MVQTKVATRRNGKGSGIWKPGSLLPTTVVGSYSVPEWLERLKTDYYQRRVSAAYLQEIHEVAIKAALKDQEKAGVEIASDGEMRRDNDLDYFLVRMPGVEIKHRSKAFYYDYYDASIEHHLPEDDSLDPLGLVADLQFAREYTELPLKFSFTGPFSLARRVKNHGYADEAELVMAFARLLNRQAKGLAAAGAAILQMDEPFLAGYPEKAELAVRAVNQVFEGVEGPQRALHVCYGNRHSRPAWEGHYDFLFPAILEANIDQLLMEFARKGYDDLELFKRYPNVPFSLGLGVIDVKSREVEPADLVSERIHKALRVLPPERVFVNPDCGLRHLPIDIARAKLTNMVQGARDVRREVNGRS